MDTKIQSTQPISDDQELAKALAGVPGISDDNLEFEETPVPTAQASSDQKDDGTVLPEPVNIPEPSALPDPIEIPDLPEPAPAENQPFEEPVVGYNPPEINQSAEIQTETPPVVNEPAQTLPPATNYESPQQPMTPVPVNGELDEIKQDALLELRPLVDKLSLAPEERFDIYLLLLRSTDDKSLIAPAHNAAQAITDESRRAEALLNIIKEIDYLSNQQTS